MSTSTLNVYTAVINNGERLPERSFPGAYPIMYVTGRGRVLCGSCASEEHAEVENHECYMEGPAMECDGGCGEMIESAYGDPNEETSEEDEDDLMPIVY